MRRRETPVTCISRHRRLDVARRLLEMSGWVLDSITAFGHRPLMAARIYQTTKNPLQSGKARAGKWVLEFESGARRRADPMMGWSGGADTRTQVKLTFPTLEAAKAYAEREGVEGVHVVPAAGAKLKLQSYADNFR